MCLHHHCLINACFRETEKKTSVNYKQWVRKERKENSRRGERSGGMSGQKSHQMSSGSQISSSPLFIWRRTGVENVVENSGKVGIKFWGVAAIGDMTETELKLTLCKTLHKWNVWYLFLCDKINPHLISPGCNCDIDDHHSVITVVEYSSTFSKFILKLLITEKSRKAFSLLKTQVRLNLLSHHCTASIVKFPHWSMWQWITTGGSGKFRGQIEDNC